MNSCSTVMLLRGSRWNSCRKLFIAGIAGIRRWWCKKYSDQNPLCLKLSQVLAAGAKLTRVCGYIKESLTVIETDNPQHQCYQRLLTSASYGFWEWNPRDDSVLLSGAFWAEIGYLVDPEGQRFSVEDVAPFFHEGDWCALLKSLAELLERGENYQSQVRSFDSCGQQRWLYLDGSVARNTDNELVFVSGIALDHTKRHELEQQLQLSEERHQRILTASNDGIWEWSRESVGYHFSDKCWQQLGYDDPDSLLSSERNRLELWQSSMHEEDLEYFKGALEAHLKNNKPYDIEFRIKHRQGHWVWIRARGQADFDADGQPYRMSGTNMDITHIKEAEEKVLLAKEEAEKANQAKSEFLSSMSHELRTPLNAILGYAQLFGMDTNLSDSQQQSVREIRKAGSHLLQLISDVLDLSKVESGQMSISVEPVLAKRIVEECLALMQPLAEAKQIRINLDVGALPGVYVNADAVRLKQALLNLLSNALKYNREGGHVDVKFSQPTAGMLRLEVCDSGLGIPLGRQAEVFEPFNRLGAEGSSTEGSGVGLVITKRLVEMMGGDLSFVSREGEGSRFWIQLPQVADWSAMEREVPVQEVIGQGSLQVSGERRILYVEDNPSNTRLMEQVFRRFSNLHLETANEAFFGLYKARTSSPDLIILDINLPGMDGYEALSVLQRDPLTQAIPVIALSANAMPDDIAKGEKAGFAEYLTKPLDVERLMATFNRLLVEG